MAAFANHQCTHSTPASFNCYFDLAAYHSVLICKVCLLLNQSLLYTREGAGVRNYTTGTPFAGCVDPFFISQENLFYAEYISCFQRRICTKDANRCTVLQQQKYKLLIDDSFRLFFSLILNHPALRSQSYSTEFTHSVPSTRSWIALVWCMQRGELCNAITSVVVCSFHPLLCNNKYWVFGKCFHKKSN